jgi:hypothetical protein
MAVAWIGLAGAVVAALVSGWVAVRQSRAMALFERDLRAEEVLTRYRQPLAAAALDLQGRLYNVLALDFVESFGGVHALNREAARTTLFRFAQYFGWSEILRRDIQFLSFADDADSRAVVRLQARVTEHFLDSGVGEAMMIWRDEQRAIGERMIVEEHGKVICMGYARFGDCCERDFAPWLDRVWEELAQPAARERLRNVQHALCDLVELLDDRRLLIPHDLQRA